MKLSDFLTYDPDYEEKYLDTERDPDRVSSLPLMSTPSSCS